MVGHVFKPWGVDMFWDVSPCSEGEGTGQGIQELKPELSLSLPSSPAQGWGTSGWGSMKAREQEGMLHSKPRPSNMLLE